tara:strand:+ start:9055 stop:10968 length:1914 start_codon:yes stop_codon:yes gene_type:complete
MPFIKMLFKPGINREITDYSQEGGWYSSNKVRFVYGFPKKIGGWAKYTVTAFVGICRSLFVYSPSGANNFMAMGTSKKIYIDTGGSLTDITPLRLTTSAGDPRFTATDGSAAISVAETGHGAIAGDYVTFSGAASLGGDITAAVLNQEYEIDSITSANAFVFTATATANASDESGDGGGSTVAKYQISIGYDVSTAGYGWGVSTWGLSTWGTARATPVSLPMRLIFFTTYYDDLVFNVRDSDIYYWVNNLALDTRAVAMEDMSGANEVPQEVSQILISQDNTSNILLALGCTPYPASGGGAKDPLLIRWSDVTDKVEWEPTDLTTAGSLSVQSGSKIIAGAPTYRETLIYTDSTLNSLKFVGGNEVFRLDEISSSISLIGPNAVITTGTDTYWMGATNFYIYNGRVTVLQCPLSNHVFKAINTDQADQVFAGLIKEFNEVIWFYCANGSTAINSYVIYNFVAGIWYYGDTEDNFDRTAWADASIREYPQAASDDGYIYNHEYGNNADSSAITASITSANISLDEGDRYVLLQRIIPDINFTGSDAGTTPTAEFKVSAKKFPGSAPYSTNEAGSSTDGSVTAANSVASTTATVDEFTSQIYIRARGNQMAFTIESTASGVAWGLGTPRADVRPDGRRG